MNLQDEISPIDSLIHQQNIEFLVNCANLNTYQALAAAMPTILGGGDHYSFLERGQYNSRTAIFWSEVQRQLVVVANGMQDGDKVNVILQSWDSIESGRNSRFNTYFNGANVVVGSLPTNQPATYTTIRLIGHSYGGAMMHHLAKQIRSLIAPEHRIQVYTYGAPKPNDGSENSGTALIDVRRVCFASDPVPRLPPAPTDIGSLWVLTGVPTARRWSRWRQVDSALAIDNTGEMTPTALGGSIYDPGLIVSVGIWMLGGRAFGSPYHSLASYQTAVNAMTPALTRTELPQTVPVRGHAPVPTMQQLNVMRDQEIAVAAARTDADPVGVANAVWSSTPVVQGVRYRGIMVQGKPWVYYGAIPVIPCRTRRIRRALVRRLNRTLP